MFFNLSRYLQISFMLTTVLTHALLAGTCNEKLTPKVLLELHGLQKSIYSAAERADRKLLEDAFKKKIKELAVVLKTSEKELLQKIRSFIFNKEGNLQRIQEEERIAETVSQNANIFDRHPNLDYFKIVSVQILDYIDKLDISLLEIWDKKYYSKDNEGFTIVYLVFNQKVLLKEYQKEHPQTDITKLRKRLEIDFNKMENPMYKETILLTAIRHNDEIVIRALQLLGADINSDETGCSTLLSYILNYHSIDPIDTANFIKTLEFMVSKLGADINHKYSQDGSNILHFWFRNKLYQPATIPFFNFVVSHNPDLFFEFNNNGATPLAEAPYDELKNELFEWLSRFYKTDFSDENDEKTILCSFADRNKEARIFLVQALKERGIVK